MHDTLNKKPSLASRLLKPQYIMVYATVGIFLLIYLYGSFRFGKLGSNDVGFNSLRTFINMFKDNAYYGISAVGMTMVLITGGIDLSVASIACLTGMLVAYGTTRLGIHPAICIISDTTPTSGITLTHTVRTLSGSMRKTWSVNKMYDAVHNPSGRLNRTHSGGVTPATQARKPSTTVPSPAASATTNPRCWRLRNST